MRSSLPSKLPFPPPLSQRYRADGATRNGTFPRRALPKLLTEAFYSPLYMYVRISRFISLYQTYQLSRITYWGSRIKLTPQFHIHTHNTQTIIYRYFYKNMYEYDWQITLPTPKWETISLTMPLFLCGGLNLSNSFSSRVRYAWTSFPYGSPAQEEANGSGSEWNCLNEADTDGRHWLTAFLRVFTTYFYVKNGARSL